MTRKKTSLIIINGPSKLDFMLSLFDGDVAHRRWVNFSIPPEYKNFLWQTSEFKVEINGVTRAGSGCNENDYLFSGMIALPKRKGALPISGQYSTLTRKGNAEF